MNGAAREERANAEVALCAGAVQSPQLLELSGVGQPDLLREHGSRSSTNCRASARTTATTTRRG